MLAYKVFNRQPDGSLQSAGFLNKSLIYHYHEEGWNRPVIPNSGFFVFKEREQAESYARSQDTHNNVVVYLVETDKLSPIFRVPEVWFYAEDERSNETVLNFVKRFWENQSDIDDQDLGFIASGVYVTNRLKLIRKI